MNREGTFVATLLDASGKALSAGTVVRLGEGDFAAEVEDLGFQSLVHDVRSRLASLAEALAVGRPELLQQEIRWLASTYTAREVPQELLRESMVCLRHELSDRLPEDSAALACTYVDAALETLSEAPEAPAELLVNGHAHVELAREFLEAALDGRRHEAVRLVLDAFQNGVGIPELHRDVLTAVQSEVGRLWQVGEVDVAEEHLASHIVEEALVQLRARAECKEDDGRRVIVAAVPGSTHEIGGRMVADQFGLAGWRAYFLGADTPAEDLVASLGRHGADLVALSAGLGLHLRATANVVERIRAHDESVPVIVGGRPFALIPDLWRDVGADGFAPNAERAVVEGARLVEAQGAGA